MLLLSISVSNGGCGGSERCRHSAAVCWGLGWNSRKSHSWPSASGDSKAMPCGAPDLPAHPDWYQTPLTKDAHPKRLLKADGICTHASLTSY